MYLHFVFYHNSVDSLCNVYTIDTKTRAYDFHKVHNMLADVMATQRAMVSTAVVLNYRQTSDISGTLVGNKTDDHSDVVGASPIDTAAITSSFST